MTGDGDGDDGDGGGSGGVSKTWASKVIFFNAH